MRVTLPPCDSDVWLADGLPGVVTGVAHHYVVVRWHNGKVTKVPPHLIVHHQPFTPPAALSREERRAAVSAWYDARVVCPSCREADATIGMHKTVLYAEPFCDNRTPAWCLGCGWAGLVMELLPRSP